MPCGDEHWRPWPERPRRGPVPIPLDMRRWPGHLETASLCLAEVDRQLRLADPDLHRVRALVLEARIELRLEERQAAYELDRIRSHARELARGLKSTSEHLAAGIRLTQRDVDAPPEPVSAWDADAVTNVVADRALLADHSRLVG